MAGNEIGNSQLTNAKKIKNDEFYTQLTDIEKELRHYRKHFKNKTVFCNCDDPFESNFFKYFVLNFNRLGLKKLIATCYVTSPIIGQQLSLFDIVGGDESNKGKPYKAIVTQVYDKTGDGGVDMLDVAELFKSGENILTELHGDGDFRSNESIELLKESDIVATNPPFSLFREYVATLIEYEKDFVIMGNKNAITYKEFFPYLRDGKVWVGATSLNGGRWMIMPDDIDVQSKSAKVNEYGETILNVAGVCWFTNMDIKKRHEEMILIRKYEGNEEEFPTFDNYDAINVDKVTDIPYDYLGVMGVPITFFDKYNPEQFELITFRKNKEGIVTPYNVEDEFKEAKESNLALNEWRNKIGSETLLPGVIKNAEGKINGRNTYARVLIRQKIKR